MQQISPNSIHPVFQLDRRCEDLPRPPQSKIYDMVLGLLALVGSYGIWRRSLRFGVCLGVSVLGVLLRRVYRNHLYSKNLEIYFESALSSCQERHSAKCQFIMKHTSLKHDTEDQFKAALEKVTSEIPADPIDNSINTFLDNCTHWYPNLGDSLVEAQMREIYQWACMARWGASRPPLENETFFYVRYSSMMDWKSFRIEPRKVDHREPGTRDVLGELLVVF